MRTFEQSAPWPAHLERCVETFRYKPGWEAKLVETERNNEVRGLTLFLAYMDAPDATEPGRTMPIVFPFAVPAEFHDDQGWEEWLFDRVGDAEDHERSEWFQVDGRRPFRPKHEPNADGYRTRYRGD